jgi:hypothetical protein
LSADVYCPNVYNRKHTQSSYLYETERRGKLGKTAEKQRERERVRVCDSCKIEVGSVVGRMDYLGSARITIDRYTLIARRYFNGKDSSSGLKNIL